MAQETTTAATQVPGLEDIQPHVFTPPSGAGQAAAAPARQSAPSKLHFQPAPGPLAIISDIHANIEALTAVLADIDARGLKQIICLGDVVGYGPNPLECMDIVMQRCAFS